MKEDHSASSGNRRSGLAARRSARIAQWIIVGMIVVWVAALLSRNVIRAHWWGYRITAAESPQERLFYFHRLASLGDRSVPVAGRLLDAEDAGLRSMGVGILHHARSEASFSLLLQAGQDPDEEVRRLAVFGLAMRDDPRCVSELNTLARSSDERTGMMAAAALATVESESAAQVLMHIVRDSAHAGVRIEAIEGLEARGCREAIDVLIDILDDETVFEGVTESGILALRAFDGIRSELTDEAGPATDLTVIVPRRHVVGYRAEQALRAITGNSPELPANQAADRARIKRVWREWRRVNEAPVDDSSP